jgi:uncharacterized protein YcgI (DUF1989 family)
MDSGSPRSEDPDREASQADNDPTVETPSRAPPPAASRQRVIEANMAITQTTCHVSQGSVIRVTDMEGRVTQLICSEFDAKTGTCRLRVEAMRGGPLSRLLDRVSERALDEPGTRCILH